MEYALIGVDLGTTTCKSVVFNEKLEILGEAYAECKLIHISENEIEQDMEELWKLVILVIKQSVQQAKIVPDMVRGISVSSQGITFVPVDQNCVPLSNAISWLDTRAVAQREHILSMFDEKNIFEITGKRTGEGYALPKLMWLKQNKPEIFRKTFKFLMPHDYIIAKLCGEFVTDHTMASGTLLYDIVKQDWSKSMLEIAGIKSDKLPQLQWSGTPVGTLGTSVANKLELSKNVVVSVGGQDQKCAALGAGICKQIATASLGTATAISLKCDRPVIDEKMRIPCFSDLFKNNWVLEGVVVTSCASLKWLKQTLFDKKSYKELDEMVKEADKKDSSLFFYPYLAGACTPFLNSDIRGVLSGISLSTDTGDIVKSVFEGVGYLIRANLEVMTDIYETVEEIRIFGGGARSEIWCQLISDIVNKPVAIPYTHETASAGAAILAGKGCGIIKDAEGMSQSMKVTRTFSPREKSVDKYRKKFSDYILFQKKFMN